MRALAWVLFAACADTSNFVLPSSTTLATSQLQFPTSFQSNGLEVLVTVRSSVRVDGSDSLFFEAPDVPRKPIGYVAGTLGSLVPTRSTRLSLGLVRASETEQRAIDLPAAFTITTPAGPASRRAPITFTWDPSPSDVARITFSGCGAVETRALGTDLGSFAIQPADLFFVGRCSLELTVTRSRTIPGDQAFPRAPIIAEQVRTVILETEP